MAYHHHPPYHLHDHHSHLFLLLLSFFLNLRLGSLLNHFLHRPSPFLPDWFHGLTDHLTFYSAQRLDLFAWCVRLSRLLVGFRTHFKSLHFLLLLQNYKKSIKKYLSIVGRFFSIFRPHTILNKVWQQMSKWLQCGMFCTDSNISTSRCEACGVVYLTVTWALSLFRVFSVRFSFVLSCTSANSVLRHSNVSCNTVTSPLHRVRKKKATLF